jgi:hypothetical protein
MNVALCGLFYIINNRSIAFHEKTADHTPSMSMLFIVVRARTAVLCSLIMARRFEFRGSVSNNRIFWRQHVPFNALTRLAAVSGLIGAICATSS